MKKILLLLISLLCIFISPMTLFADEASDFEKIASGKGSEFNVGDVVDLPLAVEKDGSKAKTVNAKFLVIGKDEDYQNTLTLMSIEPIKLYDSKNKYIATSGTLEEIQTKLANGTYDGTPTVTNLIGYNDSMFFTTKANSVELSIENSQIEKFSDFWLNTFEVLGQLEKGFAGRIINTAKQYTKADGSIATISTKFWLPSLKELGFDSDIQNGKTYTLFSEKDIMTYLDEKGLDNTEALNMFTRDIDYENNKLYAIKHSEEKGYIEESNRYATYNFGACFTITYDDDPTEEVNPSGEKDVILYANKPSTYYVLMPKKVYVQSEQTTPFNLIVYGDIETDKTIDIETPDTISLKEKLGDRDDIDLVIDGGNDSIDYSMIDDGKKVVEVINVTAPRIYAGEWEVNLPISISLD